MRTYALLFFLLTGIVSFMNLRSRDQQINELLCIFPGASVLTKDRSQLEIPVLSPEQTISERLLISLPSGFPSDPPVVLSLNASDRRGGRVVTELPSLRSWGVPGIHLATVVQEATEDLYGRDQPEKTVVAHKTEDSPVTPRESPNTSSARTHTRSRSESPLKEGSARMKFPFFGVDQNTKGSDERTSRANEALSPSPAVGAEDRNITSRPAYPRPMEFSHLARMSTEELEKALLKDDSFEYALSKVITDEVARSGSAANAVASMRHSNLELARANLAKEAEINEVRRQIAIVRSTEYEPALEESESLRSKQEAIRENLAPEKLIDRLSEIVEDAGRAAEEVETSFTMGEMPMSSFTKEYALAKSRYHRLDMKCKAAHQTIPMDRRPPKDSS